MSIDLEKLEQLAAKATPGPWATADSDCCVDIFTENEYIGNVATPEDAAYIVAACNAVPELIERVRELEKERFLIIHAIAGKYGRSEAVELQKFLEESKDEQAAKEANHA